MDGRTVDTERRVREVIAAVLGLEPEAVGAYGSAGSIDGWDSMRQINIIFALEDEFGVHFSDDEVAGLSSVRALCDAVETRRVGQA